MNTFDPEFFLNQSETCHDDINLGQAQKIALSLDDTLDLSTSYLPYLWHWAFFTNAQAYAELGPDGHAASGGFPRPVAKYNRMWAGGRISFIQQLHLDMPAIRQSKIISATEKQGSSGKLIFVTIQHQYLQDNQLCISEEQDIVYKQPAPPVLIGKKPEPNADWQDNIYLDSVHLFRYSAVTFNSHRIHYDLQYAKETEGYPGLVIHGPLLATLMLKTFLQHHPGAIIKDINYRGLRPLIAPSTISFAGSLTQAGQADLWAAQHGTLAHQAKITFEV